MTSKPSQQELINRYIADSGALAAQEARGELPDIAGRCIHLYGADDAARDLLSRFAVDVVGSAEHKQ